MYIPSPAEIENQKNIALIAITIEVNKAAEGIRMPQKEIARRIGTSESQISRLMNPKNNKKTVDQLIKIAIAIGYRVKFDLLAYGQAPTVAEEKFAGLPESQRAAVQPVSQFKPLIGARS